MVPLMVTLARTHDHLLDLGKRGWVADPAHPDVDALNEATKLVQAYSAALQSESVVMGKADMRGWFTSSRDDGQALVDALRNLRAGRDGAADAAAARFEAIQESCNACHAAYRN
jgi:cytochrome c556